MRASIIVVLASTGLLGGALDPITNMIADYGYPQSLPQHSLKWSFPPIPSKVIFPLVGFTAQSGGLGLGNAIGMAATGALGSSSDLFRCDESGACGHRAVWQTSQGQRAGN
ncbi:MAG TPA: hypothetical protein VGJ42_01660 [Nitrososphaera sp.]